MSDRPKPEPPPDDPVVPRDTRAAPDGRVDGDGNVSGGWAMFAIALSVVVIGALTLRPGRPPGLLAVIPPWSCIVCGTDGAADALLNVLLFVPLGVSLALGGLTTGAGAVIVVLTTAAIEVAQATVIPFRYAALGDVVWNTLGGLLGMLIAPRWRTLLAPGARLAWCFATGALTVFIAVLATSLLALRPSIPRHPARILEFGPCRHPAPDSGAWLPDFRYGDVAVARGEVVPPDALVRAWERGALRVTGVTNPGSCETIHALVSSDSAAPDEWAGFNRGAMSVTFRIRLRAADLRLRQPWVTVPVRYVDLFETTTAQVEGRYARGRLVVGVRGASGDAWAEAPLSMGVGWTLLYPFARALNVSSVLMNVAWLSVLALPLGFYLTATLRSGVGGERCATGRGVLALPLLACATLVAGDFLAVGTVVPANLGAAALGLLAGAALQLMARAALDVPAGP